MNPYLATPRRRRRGFIHVWGSGGGLCMFIVCTTHMRQLCGKSTKLTNTTGAAFVKANSLQNEVLRKSSLKFLKHFKFQLEEIR